MISHEQRVKLLAEVEEKQKRDKAEAEQKALQKAEEEAKNAAEKDKADDKGEPSKEPPKEPSSDAVDAKPVEVKEEIKLEAVPA